MTGTGTENDPYIVDNIADFRTACQKKSEVYVELSSDIDCMDDETISDGWTTLRINCKKIDGKGHTIKNIYTTAGYTSDMIVLMNGSLSEGIHNLNFENIFFNHTGNGCLFLSSGAGYFKNCNFSGIINSSSDYCFCNASIRMTKCTFNFKIYSTKTSGFRFSYSSMESCEVRLDVSAVKTSVTANTIARYFKNSYAVGSIKFQNTDINASKTRMFYSASNSYIAMSVVNVGSGFKFSDTNVSLACFYNADLLENAEFEAQDNVYALTTEQCKDRDYLNSIGFVVV